MSASIEVQDHITTNMTITDDISNQQVDVPFFNFLLLDILRLGVSL